MWQRGHVRTYLGMNMPQIGGPMMLVAAHAVVLSVLLFAVAVWGSVNGVSASRDQKAKHPPCARAGVWLRGRGCG